MTPENNGRVIRLDSTHDTFFAAMAIGTATNEDAQLERAAWLLNASPNSLPLRITDQHEIDLLKKGLLEIVQSNREADSSRAAPPDPSRGVAIAWLNILDVEVPPYQAGHI